MLPNRTFLLPVAGLFLAATAGLFLQPSLLSGITPGADALPQVDEAKADASTKSATPYGRFAELHSCELFTGGCTASAESTLEGRYMLRFWKFEGGQSPSGQPMAGLTVALLEKGDDNIALPENSARQAIAYIPQSASASQREALLSWARTQTSVCIDAVSDVREVPLSARIWEGNAQVSAGKDIAFTSRIPESCGPAGCGERLWYEPRNTAATFMVEQVANAHVVEPALSLEWKDHGRRTVFTGQFGPMAGRTPAFCGTGTSPASRL